jgi:hypothetical protein
MAKHLVICFDPKRLLRPPCPALYPEWGREFVLLSGKVSTEDWSRCATAMAAFDSYGSQVSIWHLTDVVRLDTGETGIPAVWSSAPPVLQRRFAQCGPVLLIDWQHSDSPVPAPGSEHSIIIRTAFERPAPAGERELAQIWLLPIGLRFLLDRQVLLRGQHVQAGEPRQLAIVASEAGMPEAIVGWLNCLTDSKQQLEQRLGKCRATPCGTLVHRTEVERLLEMKYVPGDVRDLEIRLFHDLQRDEIDIINWFTTESKALQDAFSQFQSSLVADFKLAVATLANAEPVVKAGNWAQALSGGSVIDDVSMSHDAVRSAIVERMAALTGRPPTQKKPEGLDQTIQDWLAVYRTEVIRRARLRPTATVTLAGLGASAALFLIAWAWGIALPAGSPVPLPLLEMVALSGLVLLAVLGAAGVFLKWRKARQSLNAARAALHQRVRNHFEDAAAGLVQSAREALETMLLGRNLELVERDSVLRLSLLAQHEHHLDMLNLHLALGGDLHAQMSSEMTVAEPVDPILRPEDQKAYWWRVADGHATAELRIGKAATEANHSPETLSAVRRLAGAKFVEIDYH